MCPLWKLAVGYVGYWMTLSQTFTSIPQSFLSKLPSNLRAARNLLATIIVILKGLLVVQLVVPFTIGKIASSNFRMNQSNAVLSIFQTSNIEKM